MRVPHAKPATSISHLDITPAGEVLPRHRLVRTREPEVKPEFGSLPVRVEYVRRCPTHGVQVLDEYDPSHPSSVFCPMGGGHWTDSWFVCKNPYGKRR